ncbi:Leu/Ile/Val-binding protein [bacterium HR40]|nr:Leu/Ile/Val-binding protein [bacterium HR40]
MKRPFSLALAACALVFAGTPVGAQELRIGMLTTLSGPGSGLGIDIRDGFRLGIEHLGGKLGGLETVVVEADDERKPDVAVQKTDEMISRERIYIMTGQVWSNLALAMMPTLARNQVFFISPNAGPSQLAGKQCNPWFFNTAWQNDNNHEATGAYVQKRGFNRVYLLAPNYPAGHDSLNGFKRYYKGGIAGEVYTPLEQMDYAAEIANLRAAQPDAVFFFLPGGLGINFIKQYAQAGLKDRIPLFGPAFSFSQDILQAVGEAAVGAYNGAQWSPDLPNELNRKFVDSFKQTYGRLPSLYASQGYDTALVIDAALRSAGDKWMDKATFRLALEKVVLETTRGAFRFNRNHFPVQDYYIRQVVKLEDGTITNRIVEKIFEDHEDAYVQECPMNR